MAENGLQMREQAYRRASLANDYFVTGLAAVMFLASALFFGGPQTSLVRYGEVATAALFGAAILAGLKKIEYYVAILGADYSLAMTEGGSDLGVRESTAVIRDLNDTVERLSAKASIAHRLRNWCLVLGILLEIAARFCSAAL